MPCRYSYGHQNSYKQPVHAAAPGQPFEDWLNILRTDFLNNYYVSRDFDVDIIEIQEVQIDQLNVWITNFVFFNPHFEDTTIGEELSIEIISLTLGNNRVEVRIKDAVLTVKNWSISSITIYRLFHSRFLIREAKVTVSEDEMAEVEIECWKV